MRTAAHEATKTNIGKDLQFLKRLWKDVRKKGTTEKAPAMVYQEMDLASRAVRDYLTSDVAEIWVDDEGTAEEVSKFTSLVFPRRANLIKVHSDTDKGLFDRFNLERQIQEIHGREVSLPSGGALVFDHTEALTAVDINSGRISGKKNFREMAFKTNMEAAEAVAQQLRLRDIGGQIVIDFIEMKDKNHCREVEKTLRAAVKSDRARTDVGRLSAFGLLEMVRQRLGSSAISISSEPCPCCKGTGMRRNMEWQSIQALKAIYRQLRRGNKEVLHTCHPELAQYLANAKRAKLMEMEADFEAKVTIGIALGPAGG